MRKVHDTCLNFLLGIVVGVMLTRAIYIAYYNYVSYDQYLYILDIIENQQGDY
jgi:hypothetical protein